MAQRYFRVSSPTVGVQLSNGVVFKRFELISHEEGIIAPQMEFLINELSTLASRGVGGVSEINEAQYTELLKKKPTTLPPRWRDEYGEARVAVPTSPQPQSPSTTSSPNPVAAVAKADPIPPVSTGGFRPSAVKE